MHLTFAKVINANKGLNITSTTQDASDKASCTSYGVYNTGLNETIMAIAVENTGLGHSMQQQVLGDGEEVGDDVLAARCAEGDDRAFQLLVDRHLPRILALAKRMLGNEVEAEDVSQEALLRLWRHASDYEPERAKLSTWLYRVTSNLCIDRLRGRKHTGLDEAPEPVMVAGQDRDVLQEQMSRRVDGALQILPERQRLALVLFHFEELSMNEVADCLECSVEAVESLLSRGRRQLRKDLEDEWRLFMPGVAD